MTVSSIVDELAAAGQDIERIRDAREAALDAAFDAEQLQEAANLELAEADRLEAEVALGKRDAGDAAAMRTAATDKLNTATAELHRQTAIADALRTHEDEAVQRLAELRVAEISQRMATVSRKASEVAVTEKERLLAALAPAKKLARLRLVLDELEHEARNLAAAAGVDAPTRVDEPDWRPDGWEQLVEVVQSGPRRAAAKRATEVQRRAAAEQLAERHLIRTIANDSLTEWGAFEGETVEETLSRMLERHGRPDLLEQVIAERAKLEAANEARVAEFYVHAKERGLVREGLGS